MLSGAALIIYQGSDLLEEELRIEGITYADLPPSILGVYEPTRPYITKSKILIGGEVCPLDVLEKHRRKTDSIGVWTY